MSSCISLQGSSLCPRYSSLSINAQALSAAWPFFENVQDVASFDQYFGEYLSPTGQFAKTKQYTELGCSNYQSGYVLQYQQTFLCGEFTGITYSQACNADISKVQTCQSTCYQFADSELNLVNNTSICPTVGSTREAYLTKDFTACTDWASLATNNTATCIEGSTNEANCGFGPSSGQLCSHCSVASGNQVSPCCLSSNTDLSSCDYSLQPSNIATTPSVGPTSPPSQPQGASSSSSSSIATATTTSSAVNTLVTSSLTSTSTSTSTPLRFTSLVLPNGSLTASPLTSSTPTSLTSSSLTSATPAPVSSSSNSAGSKSSSLSSSSSSNSTSNGIPSTVMTDHRSSRLSAGGIAGAVVGSLIGALLLLLLLLFCVRRRQRQQSGHRLGGGKSRGLIGVLGSGKRGGGSSSSANSDKSSPYLGGGLAGSGGGGGGRVMDEKKGMSSKGAMSSSSFPETAIGAALLGGGAATFGGLGGGTGAGAGGIGQDDEGMKSKRSLASGKSNRSRNTTVPTGVSSIGGGTSVDASGGGTATAAAAAGVGAAAGAGALGYYGASRGHPSTGGEGARPAGEDPSRPISGISAASSGNEGRMVVPSFKDLYSPATIYPGNYVEAIYSYNAALSDELSLKPGDTIRVNKLYDDNWANGAIELTDGSTLNGAFPLVCVSAVMTSSGNETSTSKSGTHTDDEGFTTDNYVTGDDQSLHFR